MHVKTIIFDGEVVLTGSMNLTHNGVERSKEHLYRIQYPDCVKEVSEDFEETWEEGTEVTEKIMTAVLATHERKRAESFTRSPQHSQSEARLPGRPKGETRFRRKDTFRSLDREFRDVSLQDRSSKEVLSKINEEAGASTD